MPYVTALDREMMARGIQRSHGGLPDPVTCPAVHVYCAALAHATREEFQQIAEELWDAVARQQWQVTTTTGSHTLH